MKNTKVRTIVALLLSSLTNFGFAEYQNKQITGNEWSNIIAQVQSSITIAQDAYIKPDSPVAGDNLGFVVDIDGDTLVLSLPFQQGSVGGIGVSPLGTGALYSGAVYVFVKTNGMWAQQEFIKPSDNAASYYFGASLAIDGDTLVVGATGKNSNRGAIYIYSRSGATWTESQIIDSQQPISGTAERFGSAVDISADKMIVGVASAAISGSNTVGRADTFQLNQTTSVWEFVQSLELDSFDGGESCGGSVAIDGDYMLIGCPGDDSNQVGVISGSAVFPHTGNHNSGLVEYYSWNTGSAHTRLAYIKASNPDTFHSFGRSVAISGGTIAIGSPGENRSSHGINGDQVTIGNAYNGAVYVFVDDGVNITQQAYVKTSSQDISEFGSSVSISGDQIAVGAPGDTSSSTGIDSTPINNVTNAGAVYSFSRNAGIWQQDAYIKASNTEAVDRFGVSVAISNGVIIVGANGEGSGIGGVNNGGQGNGSEPESGAGYVFSNVDLQTIFNNGFE